MARRLAWTASLLMALMTSHPTTSDRIRRTAEAEGAAAGAAVEGKRCSQKTLRGD